MKTKNGIEILPIKINFNVTADIKRFVNIHIILAEKVYLIDAGVSGAIEQIRSALQNAGRTTEEIGGILLTHTHPDHIGCVMQIKELAPQCKVYVSAAERGWLENIDLQYQQRPIPNFYMLSGASVQPDVLVRPGDVIVLEDDIKLEAIDCSGHSHGSLAYYWAEHGTIFTGDAIPAVNDIPIFSNLTHSIDTLRRLQNIDGINQIFSAWEECKHGATIKSHLAWAEDMLTGISTAISQVCQRTDACFTSFEDKHRMICKTLGLTALQEHPLFIRSIKAGIQEYYENLLYRTCKNLEKRGFKTVVCPDSQDAYRIVSEMLDALQPDIIGFGNSQTVRFCGILELANRKGKRVYQHDPRNFSAVEDRIALHSDVYFTSANALSEEGYIVNIDGTGNRTGATCFGPQNVIYVVGRNKITPTLDDALKRAQNAAVRLASFYKRKTPCAKTGRCHDCLAAECVCGVTTVHRKALIGNVINVILVNEDIGL